MECKICNKKCNDVRDLSVHISLKHKEIGIKKYYDMYLKKENEGICYFCGKTAKFHNLSKGYHRICNSSICLGKTRATGTHEFLMYKYGYTEEEAKIEQEKRAKSRGKKIKKALDKKLMKNPDFHREKSHLSKEFWIKRGFTETESIKKAKKIMNNNRIKASKTRQNNKEKYIGTVPTQLEYWIKKGFDEETAKQKLKERQATFTREKCIKKYGEKKGKEIFKNRQRKWSQIMEEKYRNGEYNRAGSNHYSEIELKFFKNIVNRMLLNNKEYYSAINENQYTRTFKEIDKTFSYDFVYNKKVVEFNGNYWHCNPDFYKSSYFHKHRQLTAKEIWNIDLIKKTLMESAGYEFMTIWENDYRTDPENTIKKCIKFLKN